MSVKNSVLSHSVKMLLAELTQTVEHARRAKIIEDLEERMIKPSIIQDLGSVADYELRHYRRLNRKLIPDVKIFFNQGKLSFSQAKVLAGVSAGKQEALAREAIAKKLSVNALRQKVTGNNGAKFLREMERLANRYSEQTGFDIQIIPEAKNNKAGHWVIAYHDLDMFDAIIKKVVGRVKDF